MTPMGMGIFTGGVFTGGVCGVCLHDSCFDIIEFTAHSFRAVYGVYSSDTREHPLAFGVDDPSRQDQRHNHPCCSLMGAFSMSYHGRRYLGRPKMDTVIRTKTL
ncbi:hypothetical protein P280DRAFT_465921 [Massarina eburnea CBS 473.64]|uniref:Uncharacterized protein n=1 Tax=Massarina eburnea CBS 473.64 TaxID=1395130 RepID=A0A6A6SBP5_9PLEO|nr:hypothetical protein P280DRAFT_465921 [Massarina eburnea CBS 473.64]